MMQSQAIKLVVFTVFFIAIALLMGNLATEFSATKLIWGLIGLGIFIAAFINNEFGLYILIFSMLLSPEFMAGATEGKDLGRGLTLRVDDFLLLVIGFSWFTKTAVYKDVGLFLKTPLNAPIFLYLAVCVVSTGLGIMGGRANAKTGFFFVLKYFEYFIVYFMAANYLESKQQLNRFLLCMFLTCFVVSLYGIWQIPGGGRVSAPFEGEIGEPNTFGGYLLFLGAIAGGILPKIEDRKIRRWMLILIITIIPPLLFTQSRSTYLGAIPACLVLGFHSQRRMLYLGLFAMFLILSPFLLPSQVKERILFTFQQKREYGQLQIGELRLDTSTSDRLQSWQRAIVDSVKHPFFGHGVTGYRFMDAQYPKIFVETGLLGLSAFFYLVYSIYKLALKNLKQLKTPYYIGLTTGFIAGFTGLLFHAIGANTFIIVRIMEPFWLVAAMVFVLPELERQSLSSAEEKTSLTKKTF